VVLRRAGKANDLKLNIGAGEHNLEGYMPIDLLNGQDARKLEFADNSVDEIRASHILEHFGHREVCDVLREWVRVLKPGGLMKLAVPNFEKVARDYLDGKQINIQGYAIRYKRKDDLSELEVEYSEEVFRNGDNILYKLAKNGTPYAWGNESAEWSVPYGFVPMVQIQHHSVGMDWGASEGQSKLQLFRELDDAVSLLGDQVRKVINPFWLFTGTTKPTTQPSATPVGAGLTPVAQSGREELAAMYVNNADVKAMPLIGNINIADAIGLIDLHLDQLERAYPELQLYKLHEGGSGTLSGTAVRYRQAEAENKVQERRGGYDNALVRAQQMAVSIGGYRGYDGYEGFGLDSYASGKLDHSIAKRPVFARDIQDDLAVDKARAEVVQILTNAGGNLAQAALLAGYSEEEAMRLIQVETGIEQ